MTTETFGREQKALSLVSPILTETSPTRAQVSLGTDHGSFKEYEGKKKQKQLTGLPPETQTVLLETLKGGLPVHSV